MTDKEAYQQQKIDKVKELYGQQKALIAESVELHKSNPNLGETFPSLLSNSFRIRLLEAQKQVIISQPFPKFKMGTPALINETGPELIDVTLILSRIFPKDSL